MSTEASRNHDLPTYRVSKLKAGTVIDHLDPGSALQALAILEIPPDTVCAIGMNFESRKHGRKEIIKIEGMELGQEDINKIVLFGPHATLSIIRDYELVNKIKVKVPEKIEGVVPCPNPSCITNHERITTRFDVLSPELRVIDCETTDRMDDPERWAKQQRCELAYSDNEIPRDVQHWFVVASPSLYAWLERWLAHGIDAVRWHWLARSKGRTASQT